MRWEQSRPCKETHDFPVSLVSLHSCLRSCSHSTGTSVWCGLCHPHSPTGTEQVSHPGLCLLPQLFPVTALKYLCFQSFFPWDSIGSISLCVLHKSFLDTHGKLLLGSPYSKDPTVSRCQTPHRMSFCINCSMPMF